MLLLASDRVLVRKICLIIKEISFLIKRLITIMIKNIVQTKEFIFTNIKLEK